MNLYLSKILHVLYQTTHHDEVRWSGGIDPRILNLGTVCRLKAVRA
jgi:hypothetical protein